MAKVRFLFATDLHGSETVWRKFLNSSKVFELDALVISGDMTGKLMIPITSQPDGKWTATIFDEDYVLTEAELPDFETKIRMRGYIPHRTNRAEADLIAKDETTREQLFQNKQIEIVKHWLSLIPGRVPDKCRIILTPGNDDVLAIDDMIRSDNRVIYGEEEVVKLDDEHEVACCGWTNVTPWKTPRETSEENLLSKLLRTVSHVSNFETAVFCFHCPPYNTGIIDLATQLTPDLKPVYAQGRPVMIPVGSKAVREVIEKYQPLLTLHGHIHEAPGFVKIGRTTCLNPGSEYGEGILRAYLVELNRDKVTRLQRVEA